MPGLAGAFWAQTEQHSGCGAASPSQGPRDTDSLRAALSLGAGGPVMKNLPANARDIGRLRLDPCVRKIPWSRAWQTTPVFLPRESHGQRSLAGQGLWGCKELNMTLRLNNSVQQSDSVTFFIFFFIMVYYRILNIVLCAIQWDLVVYLSSV